MNNDQKKSRFLVFSIGSEFYGIKIETVREIIRYNSLTPVHDSQDYIMGVINLRGKILPVMDLRLKFGMDFAEYTDKTVLLVLEMEGDHGKYHLALAVDAVHEVISPPEEDLKKTPQLGLNLKRNYLNGILKTEDHMIMILDINRIVAIEEIIHLEENLAK